MDINKCNNRIIKEDIERIVSEKLPWDMFKNASVLVAGASGMIPSYVVYTLLRLNDKMDMGIQIIALVRNEDKARKILGNILNRNDISLISQDVCKPLLIEGNVDYIIHGASSARPGEHKVAPTNTIRANLLGTFNLLDLAIEKNARGFVLMSSSEVYGTVSETMDSISETDYGYLDCLNPRSCYSEGKRAAETICASYTAQYGIKCTIPRFAHIYGPGLALDDGRVQADFAANVVRNENIVMKSDGSSKRAYTYVSDAVSGMFYAMLKGDDIAYNVADSKGIISIKQLAEAFINAAPEKGLSLIIDIPKCQESIYNSAKFIGLNDSKIKSLGWMPKVNIYNGTRRMINSYE